MDSGTGITMALVHQKTRDKRALVDEVGWDAYIALLAGKKHVWRECERCRTLTGFPLMDDSAVCEDCAEELASIAFLEHVERQAFASLDAEDGGW